MKGVKGSQVLTGSPWPQRTRSCSRSGLAAAFSGCGLFTPLAKFVVGVVVTPTAVSGAHGARHSAAERHSTAPATLRATSLVFRKTRNYIWKRN